MVFVVVSDKGYLIYLLVPFERDQELDPGAHCNCSEDALLSLAEIQ